MNVRSLVNRGTRTGAAIEKLMRSAERRKSEVRIGREFVFVFLFDTLVKVLMKVKGIKPAGN